MTGRTALSWAFWLAFAATAALAFAGGSPWVSAGGLDFDGASGLIRAAVPVDPVWIYGAAGLSAFGLLVFALTRRRAAFALCVAAAAGALGVLLADARDLLEELDFADLAWGLHLAAGSALVLLAASLGGLR